MPRGAQRKHDPTIPRHIDQTKLPRGIYWQRLGKGRWYVVVPDPESGRLTTKVVAGPSAGLSDLHAIMKKLTGDDARGTISYVSARYWESTEFAEKCAATRETYKYSAKVASEFKTDKGKGPALDQLYVDRLSLPVIQAVVETIAKGRKESTPGAGDSVPGYPAKANHLLRYFRVLFGWACGTATARPIPPKAPSK